MFINIVARTRNRKIIDTYIFMLLSLEKMTKILDFLHA